MAEKKKKKKIERERERERETKQGLYRMGRHTKTLIEGWILYWVLPSSSSTYKPFIGYGPQTILQSILQIVDSIILPIPISLDVN